MFFRVYGEPLPVARKRHTIYQKRTGRHYPSIGISHKSEAWKRSIQSQISAWICQYGLQEKVPLSGPLHLDLWIFRTRPKSVKTIYPDKRPDLDNMEKLAIDGISGALIRDDDCLIEIHQTKRWAGLNYPDCGVQLAGIVYMLSPMPKLDKKRLNSEYEQLQGITPLLDRDAMRSDREADMREFLVSGLKGVSNKKPRG